MPYSPVTQPLPWPFINDGTPSSTVAVQITRVLPISISTLPSALVIKSGVIFTGRIWSWARPSLRKVPPRDMDGSLTAASSTVNHSQKRVATQFGSGTKAQLPAPGAGGLYKTNCNQRGRFCRGLSIPVTVIVHGEPCFPGRRGHLSFPSDTHPNAYESFRGLFCARWEYRARCGWLGLSCVRNLRDRHSHR